MVTGRIGAVRPSRRGEGGLVTLANADTLKEPLRIELARQGPEPGPYTAAEQDGDDRSRRHVRRREVVGPEPAS